MIDIPLPPEDVGQSAARPRHFDLDAAFVFELVERKDASQLHAFGGVERLAKLLQSDFDDGINSASVVARQEQFGRNELLRKEPARFITFFVEAFKDLMVQILCVAAIVSIVFGMTLQSPHTGEVDREKGWIEGTAILISVAVVTLTGSVNNFQKAKKFEEMEREQAIRELQVIRDGIETTIFSNDLVVGDVLLVENGMQLDCDGVLIRGVDFKCNESAMTGETDVVEKDTTDDPFFLSGTLVEEGSGRILVIAVGMDSYEGKMKKSTDEDSGNTPLQEHLEKLADDIGKLGFAGAFILVAGLCIKEGVEISSGKDANATTFLNFLIIAITIVVVAIPEGLPLAVTISLAFSMKSMMKDNCMVRVLASCETMGAATAICSDKTGTLTTNEMTVVQGLVMEEEFLIAGYGLQHPHSRDVNEMLRDAPKLRTTHENLDRFFFAMAINSTAREQKNDKNELVWVGNKTEHGLMGFVKLLGRNYMDMRDSVNNTEKRHFPFHSEKKRMTTAVRDSSGAVTAYVKGAWELIIDDCSDFMDAGGEVRPLTPTRRAEFSAIMKDMARQGNRTIAVAFAPCSSGDLPDQEPGGDSLVFLGALGMQDPIREEVPQAVLSCQSAGLVVRMVTGDSATTAIAIATKCNIYSGDSGFDLAMTGKDFRRMFEEEKDALLELLPRLRILARSSPQDKYILVNLLQESGEVVGVTGDGTNDAPALKLADVGFAMHAGTDIAKGASAMVLLDNNFASVVNAIRWGRAVNDNVRKFLQYQLSVNLSGVVLTIVGSLASANSKEPLNPVQLLWLNLIMDTLAALALATEHPEEEASLRREPSFKQAPLLSRRMRVFMGIHAAFQTGVILLLLFKGHIWLNIIEDPDRCDRAFEPVQATEIVNGTQVLLFTDNATTTPLMGSDPELEACRLLCTRSGGSFDGAHTMRCKQGELHSTLIFNTFIFMQIFNMFNARKIYSDLNPFEGIFTRSQLLVKVFWVILFFQLFAVEVAGSFMGTTPLPWLLWAVSVVVGSLELLLGFVPRIIPIASFVPEAVLVKRREELELRSRLAHPLSSPSSASQVSAPPQDL